MKKQRSMSFSDNELALSVYVYAVYTMINTSVFGVIWWSFPPWLTDGPFFEDLVHFLSLDLVSASAVSSKRPAWVVCGKEGSPGHGFSFFFFFFLFFFKLRRIGTREDLQQNADNFLRLSVKKEFFQQRLIWLNIFYCEMMQGVCVCMVLFFYVFFCCCCRRFWLVFFIDYEQKLKLGDCLNLWCFICRYTHVLQVATSDQMEKLCEPLPK